MLRRFPLFILLALMPLLLIACGGSSSSKGGSTLDAAKALNARVGGGYQNIIDTYDGLKANAAGFGQVPADVDLTALDPAMMQKMFMDCLNSPVEVAEQAAAAGTKAAEGKTKAANADVKAAKSGVDTLKSCPGLMGAKSDDAVKAAPAAAQDTFVQKLQTVDTMRKQLYLIPTQTKEFGEEIKNSMVEFGELKATALASFEASKLNPLASGADKKKAEGEHQAVEAELGAVQGLVDKAKADLSSIPGDSVNIGKQLLEDIKSFPSQPGS